MSFTSCVRSRLFSPLTLTLLGLLGGCADGGAVEAVAAPADELLQLGALPALDASVSTPPSVPPALPPDVPPALPPSVPPSLPPQLPGSCPGELAGWATVPGDGVSTTTGGGNTPPVRPRTPAELQAFARDPQPRVIEISGKFSVPRLEVTSNKTLVGVGPMATLEGGIQIQGKANAPVSNIIVRNLHVNGVTTQADGDAVHILFAHHVWIDHCDIYDGPDGNLDMTHAVNWVTVSWTKIRYTTNYRSAPGEEVAQHRFASLIGHSDDNAAEDSNRLKVTFHHNWWAERVLERMPRARFGQVHVLNNYFSATGNNYAVRAGRGAQLLVEGNYFDGVKNPHVFNNANDQQTANITARNNTYNGTSGERATGGGGRTFAAAPYRIALEPPAGLPASIRRCAGPR